MNLSQPYLCECGEKIKLAPEERSIARQQEAQESRIRPEFFIGDIHPKNSTQARIDQIISFMLEEYIVEEYKNYEELFYGE